ncbi:hypothetical protein PVDT1_28 (plasmid) [Vibrio sp. 16]|nr:hypothetical protein PVDT1_28 [Vibrio sp. 16]
MRHPLAHDTLFTWESTLYTHIAEQNTIYQKKLWGSSYLSPFINYPLIISFFLSLILILSMKMRRRSTTYTLKAWKHGNSKGETKWGKNVLRSTHPMILLVKASNSTYRRR